MLEARNIYKSFGSVQALTDVDFEVRAGEVLAAECGGLQGFNALVKLGRQGSGIFWLVETEQHCERNIAEPFVRLLSELQRCLAPSASPSATPGIRP